MRLGFISDVHLANHRICGGKIASSVNERARSVLKTLQRVYTEADRLKLDRLIILGDMFDTVRPEPQLIASMAEALGPDLELDILVGNHDQVSTESKDHALSPLSHLQYVRVYEQPTVEVLGGNSNSGHFIEMWVVPFQPGPAHEWLPAVMEKLATERKHVIIRARRILCLHLGIHDHELRSREFWTKTAHDAISIEQLMELMTRYSITSAFAGNWHTRRIWEFSSYHIEQVGSLCPTGWDNPGLIGYGALSVYDADSSTYNCIEIPGPRFVTVHSKDELDNYLDESHIENNLFVRWIASPQDVTRAQDYLYSVQGIAGHIVQTDNSHIKESAQSAACAARSEVTLARSLQAYIDKLQLADNINKAALLEECRQLLGVQPICK